MPGDYWADAATADKEIKEARERLAAQQKAEHDADLND